MGGHRALAFFDSVSSRWLLVCCEWNDALCCLAALVGWSSEYMR